MALPVVQGGSVSTAMPDAPGVTRQVSTGRWTSGLMMLVSPHTESIKRASVPGLLASSRWER